VHRAVIVGNKIQPSQPSVKSDGTRVNTLWGEITWQLGESAGTGDRGKGAGGGGKEAYAMVANADRTSTNPGDALKELFNRYSPCLILIDEGVAYARQLYTDSSLPAGSFDTQVLRRLRP
jgi:predicted AAA+ superfamily ATPase